ncbi:hypothetical protein [Hamadaea tsunoensis]|uniref:hypothetical protein n=1 Tax=Hamadaea tsunoensis TaxID=53368 RepID=UPI00040F6DC0|nr:hypothetical protein [Hamadaea tsunoensis]
MSYPSAVEVLLFSEADGLLRYRAAAADRPPGVHPDDLAIDLSGLTLCTPGALLHSTSWRYAADRIVLTYAALPDPWPRDVLPVPSDAMVVSASPLMPSPATVDVAAVATHAVRHLALLVTTDPVVAAAAVEAPELWALIAKQPPGPAGSPLPPLF